MPAKPNAVQIPGTRLPAEMPTPPNAALQFDSGDFLTLDEVRHNCIAFGSTGRGKTSSIMLPMLDRFLGHGLGGLVIDVKNNMTEQVRTLAAHHGRLDDVVEVGACPTAIQCNILAGDYHRSWLALEEGVLSLKGNGRNMEWAYAGMQSMRDLFDLCRLLHEHDPEEFAVLAPSFSLLSKVAHNEHLAHEVTLLASSVASGVKAEHGPDNPIVAEVNEISAKIDADAFHLAHDTKSGQSPPKDRREQISWRMKVVRQFLAMFDRDERLMRLGHGQPLPVGKLARSGKIVVLRFPSDTGRIGALVAQMVKENFYRDIFQSVDRSPVFYMVDEYQDVARISGGTGIDDMSFLAKSREFGCHTVLATQSMAALIQEENKERVLALLANCSQKIVMQSDDPVTRQFMKEFLPKDGIALGDLGRAQAFTVLYDCAQRKAWQGYQSLQREHDRVQSILGHSSAWVPPVPGEHMATGDLSKLMEEKGLETKEETKEESKNRPWSKRLQGTIKQPPRTSKRELGPRKKRDIGEILLEEAKREEDLRRMAEEREDKAYQIEQETEEMRVLAYAYITERVESGTSLEYLWKDDQAKNLILRSFLFDYSTSQSPLSADDLKEVLFSEIREMVLDKPYIARCSTFGPIYGPSAPPKKEEDLSLVERVARHKRLDF